jgi:hypothetical protein
VYGNGWYIDANSVKLRRCTWIRPFDRARLLSFNFILQPAAFWRRWLWQQTGELEIGYRWGMDWDWLIRATADWRPAYLPVDLARWRLRPEIKTFSGGGARAAELASISRKYGGRFQPTYLVYQCDRLGSSLSARARSRAMSALLQNAFALALWLVKGTLWRNRSVL